MKSKILLVLLFPSLYSLAQDSSFLLRNYKYRTPGYKALAVGINLSGSTSSNEMTGNDDMSTTNFAAGPVNLAYTRIISTDVRLHQSSISLSSPAYFSKETINGKSTTYKTFQPSLAWNRNDRFYKSTTWFWEVGNNLTTTFYSARQKDTLTNYKNHQLGITDEVTIGFGKGRVERVQDAQMALYLLQDLAAQGLLSGPATNEKVLALARLITDINNKRVFDFRRRRIYELTRLDSFFRSSGLTDQTDIRHFTIINDDWAFAINPYRLSGANWYFRLQPSVQYNRTVDANLDPAVVSSGKMHNTTLGIGPAIGYENYLPISLKWQRDFGFSAAHFFGKNYTNTELVYPGGVSKYDTTLGAGRTFVNAFYGLGFFPNSRTQLVAQLQADGFFYKSPDLVLESFLNITANYFLGYRTYLSANVSARYTHTTVQSTTGKLKGDNASAGFAVAFSHYIF